jgi:hypothetical protein
VIRKIVIGLAAAAIATAASSTPSASAIHWRRLWPRRLCSPGLRRRALWSVRVRTLRPLHEARPWHSAATDSPTVTPAVGWLPSPRLQASVCLPSSLLQGSICLPLICLPSPVLPRVRVVAYAYGYYGSVLPPSVHSVGMAYRTGMLASGKTSDCDQAGSPRRRPGEPASSDLHPRR